MSIKNIVPGDVILQAPVVSGTLKVSGFVQLSTTGSALFMRADEPGGQQTVGFFAGSSGISFVQSGSGFFALNTNSNLSPTSPSNERMRIQNDGKVGISTTTPNQQLSIGNVSETDSSTFKLGIAGGAIFEGHVKVGAGSYSGQSVATFSCRAAADQNLVVYSGGILRLFTDKDDDSGFVELDFDANPLKINSFSLAPTIISGQLTASSDFLALHHVGLSGTAGSSTSTILGAGAGAGASVSFIGTDTAGTIIVTTGAVPTANSPVVILKFGTPFKTVPYMIIGDANAGTAGLGATSQVYVDQTNAAKTASAITAGSVALGALTTYQWNYHVLG